MASLLQRRRSTEANQTLHSVWPLPGLIDYVYIFGGCCSVTEFCQVQNSLCVLQVLRSPIDSVTARQSSSGREPNFAAFSTGRHLYSAGRPSRWALAHILVSYCYSLQSAIFLCVYTSHYSILFLYLVPGSVFTARRNARIASAVLAQETVKHLAKFGWLPLSDVAAVTKPR